MSRKPKQAPVIEGSYEVLEDGPRQRREPIFNWHAVPAFLLFIAVIVAIRLAFMYSQNH